MEVKNIISILSVLGFIVFMLSGTDPKRNYLLFVLFLFPFIDLFVTPVTMGGLKVFDAVTFITVALLPVKPQLSAKAPSLRTFLFFVLGCLLIAGTLNSEFVLTSAISLFQLVCVLVYAGILFRELLSDPGFMWTILKALKLAALLSAGFLILQLVFGLNVTLYALNPNASAYDEIIRYPSFFQDPQKYGQFLAMASFLFLIEAPGNKNSLLNTTLFIVMATALFLTGVRAAFTGLCAGLFLVFLFGGRKYKLPGLFACLAGFIIIAFYADKFALFNRGAGTNETAQVRLAYWLGALRIFDKNPLLGIGIGNYEQYVSRHAQDQYWEYFGTIEYMDHPESGYLKILVEYGIFAAAIGFLFILYPVFKAAKALLHGGTGRMLVFVTASLFSWLIAFVTVYSFSDLRIFILVVTLLCLLAVISDTDNKIVV